MNIHEHGNASEHNVATSFLFVKDLNLNTSWSLQLDEKGALLAELKERTVTEFQAMQADSRTIVVVPSVGCGFHTVSLPWLGERKARAAIPFALEEQLAQTVSTLHFAFDRAHYQQGHYLVAVIDNQWLLQLLQTLEEANIQFEAITADYFALNIQEACCIEEGLLCNTDSFKGLLGGELITKFIEQQPVPVKVCYTFTDHDVIEGLEAVAINQPYALWVAQRLLTKPFINFCQGTLQRQTRVHQHQFWYKATALVGALWVLSFFLLNGYQLYKLKQTNRQVTQQIASLYHEFFPQASQVINPRFRIMQLLKAGGAGMEPLWVILGQLGKTIHSTDTVVQSLRFQNGMLSLNVTAKTFADLELLEKQLQQQAIKVRQAQAASKQGEVVATLELSV